MLLQQANRIIFDVWQKACSIVKIARLKQINKNETRALTVFYIYSFISFQENKAQQKADANFTLLTSSRNMI